MHSCAVQLLQIEFLLVAVKSGVPAAADALHRVRQTRQFAVSERGQCVESNVVVASDGSPGAVACGSHNRYGRAEGSLI